MTEPPPSLTNLPKELQEMVVAHLTQHDAAICTRVSQSWNQFFTPIVWRHIHQKDMRRDTAITWWTAFLNSLRLEALKVHGRHIQSINLQVFHIFMDYAPSTLPCLARAEFADPRSNVKTADFIGRCTGGLRMLVIHENINGEGVKFESSSVVALLKHAPTLEIVRIESPLCFDSKHIQQLLCSAPNLKTLDLLGKERGLEHVDGCLDASDIVDSEWVCTGLEFFGCRISNIPRPDITHDIMGYRARHFVVPGTHEESVEVQRKVYAQLGRLTKLRELHLGRSINMKEWGKKDHSYEALWYFDCLSLSLDSGLGLLAALKELKTLEVPDMEVYIERIEELAWVKENWPKCINVSSDDYDDCFEGQHHHHRNPFLDSCFCHEHDIDSD